MTEVKPALIAVMICSYVPPWSQWMATGTLERCARACIAGIRSVVMCGTSSGWMAMMTGAFFSSLMSMIPVNIAQSLMLKAGMAKLWALATSRMDLPV